MNKKHQDAKTSNKKYSIVLWNKSNICQRHMELLFKCWIDMHINVNESQSKGKFGNRIRNCGIHLTFVTIFCLDTFFIKAFFYS